MSGYINPKTGRGFRVASVPEWPGIFEIWVQQEDLNWLPRNRTNVYSLALETCKVLAGDDAAVPCEY